MIHYLFKDKVKKGEKQYESIIREVRFITTFINWNTLASFNLDR